MATKYKKKNLKDFMQLVCGKEAARTSSENEMINKLSITVVCEAPDGNCPALRSCDAHNGVDLPEGYLSQMMFCRSQLRKWYGLSENEES